MSSPITKSVKRLGTRSASRHSSATSSTRKRVLAGKSTRLKPATKRAPAGKARARKAAKVGAEKHKSKPGVPEEKRGTAKTLSKSRKPTKVSRPSVTPGKKAGGRGLKAKPIQTRKPLVFKKPAPPSPPPRPTHDEAAAWSAFEAAHKEFSRGRFAEARNLFRSLVEKYHTVSEVTARARTYLAVAEARLRTELALPRDADSLYDRGVIELNRGDYVAAQKLFERALRREPHPPHIHSGLPAPRPPLVAIPTPLH